MAFRSEANGIHAEYKIQFSNSLTIRCMRWNVNMTWDLHKNLFCVAISSETYQFNNAWSEWGGGGEREQKYAQQNEAESSGDVGGVYQMIVDALKRH